MRQQVGMTDLICLTHNILAYRTSGCELDTETHELGCHQSVSARERTPVDAVYVVQLSNSVSWSH